MLFVKNKAIFASSNKLYDFLKIIKIFIHLHTITVNGGSLYFLLLKLMYNAGVAQLA